MHVYYFYYFHLLSPNFFDAVASSTQVPYVNPPPVLDLEKSSPVYIVCELYAPPENSWSVTSGKQLYTCEAYRNTIKIYCNIV